MDYHEEAEDPEGMTESLPKDPVPLPSRGQAWVQDQIRETPCWARDPEAHPLAQEARNEILTRFPPTVMSGIYKPDPPVRGPYGEAEIWVKAGTIPLGRPAYCWGKNG